MHNTRLFNRAAIEALRAGVPNRTAIKLLGTHEIKICTDFEGKLKKLQEEFPNGNATKGQLFAGRFGIGKSHLLGHLQELAEKRNFLVSRVVISKETPLYDLQKFYSSAIRNTSVPGCNDDLMTALLAKFKGSGRQYCELLDWAENPSSNLSPLFAALIYLLPKTTISAENVQQIAKFFSGGPLSIPLVRRWLSVEGASKRFSISSIKQTDLTHQRLRFIPKLIMAAGFNGWVLLIDEVELIGRYSQLQRGRSYSELSRWLGLNCSDNVPGLFSVAAITEDFKDEVIRNKRDETSIPELLSKKNDRAKVESASLCIKSLINDKFPQLQVPTAQMLESCMSKIKQCYSEAYDCQIAPIPLEAIERNTTIRQLIKSWITIWDLERLYGSRIDVETETISTDYEENPDLEKYEASEDESDGKE